MTYLKKNLWASTRTHDPFSDNSKIWPTFIYRREVPAHTFVKLPVRALINDPKKLFQKKVYVTIPQWFETFPNMSDLRSGRNRAKCGLVLNDPIDWFKLRLNQPIKQKIGLTNTRLLFKHKRNTHIKHYWLSFRKVSAMVKISCVSWSWFII